MSNIAVHCREQRRSGAVGALWDFIRGEVGPEGNRFYKPGHGWSYDWCRFRRDSRCYYPKRLNEEATKLEGYSVWIPEDRGHCPRVKWESQKICPAPSEPGPNVPGGYMDATIPYEQGGQRGGIPKPRWKA